MNKNEYAPYFETYISLSNQLAMPNDFLTNMESCVAFFETVPTDKLDYRYQPEKWSIKDILLHLIDCERIFQYRALRISRNDKTALPGFEENDYAIEGNATNRSLDSLLDEYKSVRNATVTLFNSFVSDELNRVAIASGKNISVRAIGYIILGHELHHINIIKERYL
ncbi:DinB family protein [Flavobacterium gelidilacus]|uniref:DinB family protein n=1 Tax=Flavobacterium gelidilacus TaxID=206041 RepID=UPI00041E7067|nr:DinB family protein [Flavobacterium gelidilacus]